MSPAEKEILPTGFYRSYLATEDTFWRGKIHWPKFAIWGYTGVMDERDFYTETPETKRATYACPKCRQSAEFQIRWLRRTKKKSIPSGASDQERAKFAKATDYLVRADDSLVCPNQRCRKRFEIPDYQSVVLL